MKTALVTGASRGIGRAIALRLAKDGYRVIVHCAGNLEKANDAAEKIKSEGGQAQVVQCDLRNPEKAKELIAQTGPVDVLVLNASIQYRTPWQEISLDACYEQLNCNLVSSLVLKSTVYVFMLVFIRYLCAKIILFGQNKSAIEPLSARLTNIARHDYLHPRWLQRSSMGDSRCRTICEPYHTSRA